MNPHAHPLSHLPNRNLPARATLALLVAASLLLAPLAMATGQPGKKQGSAHANIILQHHHHGAAGGGAHSDIILQHHHHAKGGAHSDIILQHHHH
ncbi:MAG TPA: hypothetical protein VGH80_07220 [Xanthomonadaceae bacterium]|jgi:hypothetical protein